MDDFKWLGPKVKCYNSALATGNYDFYKSFSVNGVTYDVGDFAIIDKTPTQKNGRVGRIMCLYESHHKWHADAKYRGVVRWYTWLRSVDKKFIPSGLTFDRQNEVVEDLRGVDVFISLGFIKMKCLVVFATKDDPVYLIGAHKLDKSTHFSCRYKIVDTKIIPIFSDSDAGNFVQTFLDYIDVNELSPITRKDSGNDVTPKNNLNKRKSALNSSEVEAIASVENEEAVSPSNPKTMRLTPKNGDKLFLSPVQRNLSVKRNLNESFNGSFSSQCDIGPVLNYSIVDNNSENDNGIKLTLRLSEKNPIVLLNEVSNGVRKKNSHDEINDEDMEETKDTEAVGTFRRSSRKVQRKSYADYISPNSPKTLSTLRRRDNVRMLLYSNNIFTNENDSSTNNELIEKNKNGECNVSDSDSSSVRPKRKVDHPKKYDKNKNGECNVSDSDSSFVRPKRKVSRPKKYDSDDNSLLSKKRNLPPSNSKRNDVKSSAKKSSKKPNAYEESTTSDSDKSISDKESTTSDSDSEEYDDIPILVNSTRPKRNIKKPLKYFDSTLEEDSSEYEQKNTKKKEKNTNKSKIEDSDRKSRTPKRYADSKDVCTPKRSVTDTPRRLSMRTSILKNTVNLSTPKRSVTSIVDSDDESPFKTPKTKTRTSTPISLKDTPTARARLIREGVITPSVQNREQPVSRDNTPLSKARTQLHVSYIPKALPCREKEFSDILNFLQGKLLDGCGGCMYVSGVPGTGKTATASEVIRTLLNNAKLKDIPSFQYVNINGMKLSEPRQSYVEIAKQLTGKTVNWEQAHTLLENKFTKPSKKSLPIVLVVDELDILCTKRQDVVYNLLDWPSKANAQLIVITIANTMDLPERLLMGRVTSRLGLTRLTFQPYTHKQLQEIVTKRLTGTDAFNPDAVQLVARKVASVSGDARRALDICRRAAEIAELEGKNNLVSMTHVNEALNAMITQPKVLAIKHCSRLEQLILQAVVAEVERTGVEETTFTNVYTMLISIAALDGFQMVTISAAIAAVARLGASRLLLTDQKCSNIHQRIILNVSTDDVFYALKKGDF